MYVRIVETVVEALEHVDDVAEGTSFVEMKYVEQYSEQVSGMLKLLVSFKSGFAIGFGSSCKVSSASAFSFHFVSFRLISSLLTYIKSQRCQ